MSDWISQPLTEFHTRPLPEPGIPAGYVALIHRYDLAVPLPARLAAIAGRHHPVSNDQWHMLTPRHAPERSLAAQLTFALRYEGVDLSILAPLFRTAAPEAISDIVPEPMHGASGFSMNGWADNDSTCLMPARSALSLLWIPCSNSRSPLARYRWSVLCRPQRRASRKQPSGVPCLAGRPGRTPPDGYAMR